MECFRSCIEQAGQFSNKSGRKRLQDHTRLMEQATRKTGRLFQQVRLLQHYFFLKMLALSTLFSTSKGWSASTTSSMVRV